MVPELPRAPERRPAHGGGGNLHGGGGDRGGGDGGGGSGPLCPRCGYYTVGRIPFFYEDGVAVCVICGTDKILGLNTFPDRRRDG